MKTNFWFDRWHRIGPLYKKFTENLLKCFGVSKIDYISCCIQAGEWRWPEERKLTDESQLLKQLTPPLVPNPDMTDKTVWQGYGPGDFSVQKAISTLRIKGNKTEWYHLVWDCVLCGNGEESVQHLFFQCAISQKVWQKMCLIHKMLCSSSDEQCWMSAKWKANTFFNELKKLALSVRVYQIWRARNRFIFQHIPVSAVHMVDEIVRIVQLTTVTWRKVLKTNDNWNLAVEWGLSHPCFNCS
ncbi:hypothetical protein ACH5RR_023753 [Cinchona calisaya]|uniref:Reverse transcriptase zinc-binding domain-containing protein n=1 Tax=Cinchona calisaya TaxID=153742 RepID=A0ABD2ZDF4_9GENT